MPTPLIEWTKDYSVSVASFDSHHQKLFDMINELHAAMMKGRGEQVVSSILKRLLDYTRWHFASEESAMLRTKFPEYGAHKKQHELLVDQAVRLCESFEAGKRDVSSRLLGVMRNWLRTHILSYDKRYAAHMRACGIQ